MMFRGVVWWSRIWNGAGAGAGAGCPVDTSAPIDQDLAEHVLPTPSLPPHTRFTTCFAGGSIATTEIHPTGSRNTKYPMDN